MSLCQESPVWGWTAQGQQPQGDGCMSTEGALLGDTVSSLKQ